MGQTEDISVGHKHCFTAFGIIEKVRFVKRCEEWDLGPRLESLPQMEESYGVYGNRRKGIKDRKAGRQVCGRTVRDL